MGRTKTIMLLVDYGCNLNCIYCYEPKDAEKRMSATSARHIISETVRDLGDEYDSFEVQFMGGEPLMSYDVIKEVSEWLWAQKWPLALKTVFVVSNGTLLNDERRAWFAANASRICIGISYDGDRQMHDTNRSSSSPRVDLDFFASLWPNQTVKMTISPQTVGSLSRGVIYLHSKGFRSITADLAMGRRVEWQQMEHLEALKAELEKLILYYLEHPELRPMSLLDIEIYNVNPKVRAKHCSCGQDLVCIDTDGTQYACHLFSPVACDGKMAAQSRGIAFDDTSNFLSKGCEGCALENLCPHCYGMNYITTGDITQQHPFTCASFKLIYLMNCKFRLLLARINKDVTSTQKITKLLNNIKRK